MTRPHITCVMMTCINGVCSGEMYQLTEVRNGSRANAKAREHYQCSAIMYGTNTMTESYGKVSDLTGQGIHERNDHVAAKDCHDFIISMDPSGIVQLPGAYITRNGRTPAHVIEILSEKVSDAYLGYLQELGVSWIFAGKDILDLRQAMEKLHDLFGIEDLILAGGGMINHSFLSAGLIDEISLVLAPAVSMDRNTVTSFEYSSFSESEASVPLQLIGCQQGENGTVWLRYLPQNAQ